MPCALLVCGFFASSVAAQSVIECDAATQLGLVAVPDTVNIRHFAKGAVTVAIVDDGRDNVATALSVLVLSPPLDEHGARQCRLVRASETDGYAALVLDTAAASYDPATGLTVVLPGLFIGTDDLEGDAVLLSVTINQATGMITPEQEMDPS